MKSCVVFASWSARSQQSVQLPGDHLDPEAELTQLTKGGLPREYAAALVEILATRRSSIR